MYTKLASAIYNDIVSGLRGYNSNPNISMEQLEDEIVETRLAIIKEYILKGIVPKRDLMMSINCIELDCESLDKCPCSVEADPDAEVFAHFQIPQLISDFGLDALEYIGSTDKQNPFVVYADFSSWRYHKYRKRKSKVPTVFIDPTPNTNGMLDGWIFDAPFLERISVVGIFKDLRQLEQYTCCSNIENQIADNLSFLDNEVKNRLIQRKLYYYRQLATPLQPNNQEPR